MRLTALIAAAALAAPLPAFAQQSSWGGYRPPVWSAGRSMGGNTTIDKVRRDIRKGRQSGQLSRAEARGLRRENARIAAFQDRLASDGLSDSERAAVQSRAEGLNGLVVAKRSRAPK
jgi:hypothetical protein